jgi:hypothetical protein
VFAMILLVFRMLEMPLLLYVVLQCLYVYSSLQFYWDVSNPQPPLLHFLLIVGNVFVLSYNECLPETVLKSGDCLSQCVYEGLPGCVLRRRGDCLKQFADEQEIVILLDKFDQSVTFNKIPRTNLCEAYQSPNLAGPNYRKQYSRHHETNKHEGYQQICTGSGMENRAFAILYLTTDQQTLERFGE